MKSIIKAIYLLLLPAFTMVHLAQAQERAEKQNTTANATTKLVNSKHFVFVAETVSPMGRGMRTLTSYYDLTIAGDTLIAALPYFGRAYSAPINPSEGGINFTSTDFTYKISEKEKGGWDIEIEPKHIAAARKMSLYISDNGYASLQVISNNRQPISFSGQIRERPSINN